MCYNENVEQDNRKTCKGVFNMEFEKVKEILENMDENELKRIWNEYCQNNSYDDQEIFEMWEIDDLFCDTKVSDFLDKLSDDFNAKDNYFRYGIYGLESFDDITDIVDFDDLTNYIVDNNETFDNDELEELIEEEDEEEESEEEE